MAFEQVRSQVDFSKVEGEILKLWDRIGAFEKSVGRRPEDNPFVFYEGPPTANGRPGFHHALARAFKDLIPRYKTMRGYRVERKGGWDCHGLPVELQVEKELGLSGKNDVEEYGVEEFNRLCRESVFRYVEDWREMSARLGFWVDMDDAYWTLDNSYIESVWWALKNLYERDLLYEGYKVTAHCPRDQTSLSSAEVAMGYETVTDPSVYVKLPLVQEEGTSLLIWTTTPWTLVSNTAVAANPGVEYATVEVDGERLILARELVGKVLGEGDHETLETRKGRDLEGKKYRRPFDYVPVEDSETLFTVVLGDYVTTTEGTGLVHTAPAYGEDDARTGRRYDLPTLHPVKPDGTFDEKVEPFAGVFVKEADPGLVEELGKKGLLFRAEEYEHPYPHCWRCGTPLLYYAKRAWYARTTAVLDDLLRENENINWVPEHIKWGRFGDWLRNNVDWALSRERYWGTPLPIWRCDNGHTTAIGSVEELEKRSLSGIPDDLHRPYVDDVKVQCEECNEEATRVPEVLDAWFDSGSMPFAQRHYPFEETQEEFERHFPAEFISEGVDQTRGWFYSLLAASTMLFGRSPYRTCMVLGHVLDAEGKKMSKSRGNVIDPWEVFSKQGADALRWALYTATSPGNPRRFSMDQVDDAIRKHLLTLWNTYSFFVTYARIDGFDPREDYVAPGERSLMDRWALSELQLTTKTATERLDAYDVTSAGRALGDFVHELSNWYVRRSRRRFWKGEDDLDKKAAHSTLYECLVAVAKLSAPFTPFIAEVLYQNLVLNADAAAPESVHLADWPEVYEALVDEELSRDMAAARRVVALGRAARNAAAIKTRQPLREVVVVPEAADGAPEFRKGIESLKGIVLDELNVKELRIGEAEDVLAYDLKPNLSVVGPKYGKLVPELRRSLAEAPPEIGERAAAGEEIPVNVDGQEVLLGPDELLVEPRERPGYALVREGELAVALNTELDEELIDEGLVRELVHAVQNLRRERGFEIEETISVTLGGSPSIVSLLRGPWGDYFKAEVLARDLNLDEAGTDGAARVVDTVSVDGEELFVKMERLGKVGSG